MGFPGCRRCGLRGGDHPEVCLACFRAATGTARGPACGVCGQGLPAPGRCANRWCGRADRAFSVAFAVGAYEGDLRRAIVAYKYAGERWWAPVFAQLIAGYLERQATWFEEFDLVVGMPAYAGPGARRGWDHVGLVLDHLVPLVGAMWDVMPGLVEKMVETAPMSGRSRWDREREAQGMLRRALRVVDPGPVGGARILVVDDVFTEGSSLHEVARVLREAGAEEVAGLVLARPPWRGGGPGGR